MTLKTGDAVRLKTGGPAMSVGNVLSGDVIRASWFVGDEIHRDLFHADQLEKLADRHATKGVKLSDSTLLSSVRRNAGASK